MSLFSKATKWLGKQVNTVVKTVGNAASSVWDAIDDPLAALAPQLLSTVGNAVAPGVGGIAGGTVGGLVQQLIGGQPPEVVSGVQQSGLGVNEVVAIVNAVTRDNEVKVDKIEQTIVDTNPQLTSAQVQASTQAVTQVASTLVPTATVNDSESVTTISFMTKATAFVNKYKWYLIGGVVGVTALILLTKKGGRRRRW